MAQQYKRTSIQAFSLIELILYVALISIVITGIIQIGWDLIYGRVKSQIYQEVNQNMKLATKRLTYELRNASGVNAISSGEICLSSTDPAHNPTRIYTSGGQVRIGWGGGGASCASVANDQPLTSNLVSVPNLSFTDLSPGPESTNIGYEITIDHTNPSDRQEWERSQTYETSVEIRSL
jgi:Tfp pilus assembly protein PilW